MSGWLVGFVGLIYLAVAVDKLRSGEPGMALMFAGYAVANAGLIWAGPG